jgi:hypothetical protein
MTSAPAQAWRAQGPDAGGAGSSAASAAGSRAAGEPPVHAHTDHACSAAAGGRGPPAGCVAGQYVSAPGVDTRAVTQREGLPAPAFSPETPSTAGTPTPMTRSAAAATRGEVATASCARRANRNSAAAASTAIVALRRRNHGGIALFLPTARKTE